MAAIRAAQLGKTVACIEKWKNPAGALKLGGTCLNVGCIPSKALLASSEEFENASHHLADHGINVSDVKLDITKMLARKEGIVEKRSEEHTSELQSPDHLVCRLLLEKKKKKNQINQLTTRHHTCTTTA